MRDLLFQIKKGILSNLYYLSLFATLAIPDICGALDSEDGRSSKDNYVSWFDKYVAPFYQGYLSGEDCYYFRCALFRQEAIPRLGHFKRILFVEPQTIDTVHPFQIVEDALKIDVRLFCQHIIRAAEKWLEEKENTELYKKNMARFIRRYPEGLPPYITGAPVIG